MPAAAKDAIAALMTSPMTHPIDALATASIGAEVLAGWMLKPNASTTMTQPRMDART